MIPNQNPIFQAARNTAGSIADKVRAAILAGGSPIAGGVNTVSNAFVQTFEKNVRFLAQQKGSKLRQFCQFRGETSKQHNWDRVGKLTATTKAGRAVASPVNDTPYSRRTEAQITKHAGDLIEPDDINQMLSDPASNTSTAISYAMGRAMDALIIAAATGNATDGAGAAVAFNNGGTPAGTQLVGDGTSAITLDLIAQVTQLFMVNDIEPETPKVAIVGPVQVRHMIEMEKATSVFYVNAKALAEKGMVTNWMGYTWIFSNLLTVAAAGTLDCLFFSEMALGLHLTKDIWAQVAQDPSRSFAWQVYSAFTGGAVRVEDEHLVAGRFLNS
jgi:hypothetical protein